MSDTLVRGRFTPKSKRIIAELAALGAQGGVTLAVTRGMRTWGEDTKRLSMSRVPVDTGALRGTIFAQTERKGDRVTATIGAGGPAAPYALAIHEHLSSHSPPSWRKGAVNFSPGGTGPKYIENPINERAKILPVEVNAELEASLKRISTN